MNKLYKAVSLKVGNLLYSYTQVGIYTIILWAEKKQQDTRNQWPLKITRK